jgi:4-amino-4-deoxy-L-arabinose transferase-like glycosyltransferase
MLQSFHNFFFASFDPAGYVTVDKPPVTFWIQTISAYVLGYARLERHFAASVSGSAVLYCLYISLLSLLSVKRQPDWRA